MGRPLFPFQVEDATRIANWSSALVAHEPRVGKTNIAIRAADLVDAKVVVIVCPAFVKANWKAAVEEFRQGGWTAYIVSYVKVGALYERLNAFKIDIDVVIIDEAHYAKNRTSIRTRELYGPACTGGGGLIEHAKHVYLLTGTPMPLDPTDLWPMLRACAPHLIPNKAGRPMTETQFRDRYCALVHTPFGSKVVGSKNYRELRRMLESDFMIRRTRAEVYGRTLQPPRMVYVEAKAAESKRLAAITDSEEGRRLIRAIEQGGLKALSREEKHAATMRKAFGLAKVPAVVEMLTDELRQEPDRKQVVFAFHTSVIDALLTGLKPFGAMAFDGRTPMGRKVRIEHAFRHDPTKRVVIGQINAMGLGLDFSAADDAFFAEQSWVGDENDQAAARVFNANKPRPVFTRFAILAKSLDEPIVKAASKKLATASKILS